MLSTLLVVFTHFVVWGSRFIIHKSSQGPDEEKAKYGHQADIYQVTRNTAANKNKLSIIRSLNKEDAVAVKVKRMPGKDLIKKSTAEYPATSFTYVGVL